LLGGVDQGKMYNRGVGVGSVGEGKEKKMYKEGGKNATKSPFFFL